MNEAPVSSEIIAVIGANRYVTRTVTCGFPGVRFGEIQM
jgi:hypothetical protein